MHNPLIFSGSGSSSHKRQDCRKENNKNKNMSGYFSPKEQFVIYPIFTFNIVLNNVILYFIFAAFMIILFHATLSKGTILSNNYGLLTESFFRTILLKIENFSGPKFSIYLPLFYSLFHLVLFSNFLGLIPYSTTPTVEFVLTLSIAFTLLIGLLFIGFLTHKFFIFALFLPSGTPIALVPLMVVLEVFAYIFRTLSLGLRLAINLITGHLLLKVCIGFVWLGYIKGTSLFLLALPLLLLTAFLSLEILIAYLQAYILIFITIITLKDISF